MKNQIVIIIPILLSLYTFSQNDVKSKVIGKVVYLNSYKNPAAGVEIMAYGSSGATSKDDGSYILNFPQANIGATVFPKVGTEIVTNGFVHKIELVNTEQLKFFNIAEDASKSPLKIIVCPKGFRDEAAKRYYKIIRTETNRILLQKEKEINRLKEKYGKLSDSVADKQKELNKLRQQHTDTILAYKKALNIASINRDDASDRINEYLNALDEGKNIKEALKKLSTKKAFKEALEGGENIDVSIKEIKEEAQGLINIYEFEKAIQKYDTINIILRNKRFNPRLLISNLYSLALLNQDQNYFTSAESSYQEILKIYKNEEYNTNNHIYSNVLNDLASLQMANNELVKAENNYQNALKIKRELAEENPKIYSPNIAAILNNLALLQENKGELTKAEVNYRDALKIKRKLVKENRIKYLPDIAVTLNNLGRLNMIKKEFSLAESNYKEALQIRREFAKKNPKIYLSDLATTLNNMAFLKVSIKEFIKAEDIYKESLKLYKLLSEENPRKFNILLARTYIGHIYLKKSQLESTFDKKIRNEGIKLINEAKKTLNTYTNENSTKVSYEKIISLIEPFFISINENTVQFNKIKNEITILKKQIEIEENPHKKVTLQKAIIEKLNVYSKKYPEDNDKDNIIFLSQNYGSLAWFALLDKDFVLAEKAAKKGLELSPNEEWINGNLALAYVLQNKYEIARSIYIKMKDKPYSNRTYSTVFLKDIEALEKSGISNKNFERVKKLLID